MNELAIEHSLFMRKNGRWCIAVVPSGGAWKDARQIQAPKEVTGGSTDRPSPAAKRWRDDLLAEIRRNGGHLPRKRASSPTLRECHVDLMKRREQLPNRKRSSIKNNWAHLRRQILAPEVNTDPSANIADVPLAEIGVPRSCAWLRAVRARCSPNHTRNVYSTACLLWDTAQGMELVGETVPNPLRSPLVVAELPRQENLTDDDGEPITIPLEAAQALLDAPDELVALERRARYAIAIFTGADDGEIAGVKWGRLKDLPEAQLELGAPGNDAAPTPHVQIRRQVSLRGVEGFASEDTPKTPNRVRDVPLHPALVAVLEAWRDRWEQLMRRKPRANDYLFPNLAGGAARPPSASLLRADLRVVNAMVLGRGEPALVEERLVELITFKAWRRTFSSTLKAAGVDEETRGRLMGHAGKTVTARNYTAHELATLAAHIAKIPLMWRSVYFSVTTENGPPQNSLAESPNPERTRSVDGRRGRDSNPCVTVLQSDLACDGQSGQEPSSSTKRGVDVSSAIGETRFHTDGVAMEGDAATEDRASATEPGARGVDGDRAIGLAPKTSALRKRGNTVAHGGAQAGDAAEGLERATQDSAPREDSGSGSADAVGAGTTNALDAGFASLEGKGSALEREEALVAAMDRELELAVVGDRDLKPENLPGPAKAADRRSIGAKRKAAT